MAKPGLDIRQVVADSTLVVAATVAGGAFLFLANLYLARILEPVSFGRFRTVIALVSTLTILVELGTGPSLLKYIAELGAERTRDLVRKVLALRAVVFLGLAVAVFLLRDPLAARVLKDPSLGHFLAAGAVVVLCIYFDISKFIVLAYRRIKLFAGSVALTSLALGTLAAALTPAAGVSGAVVGWGLGYLVGNALNVYSIVSSGGLTSGPRVDAGKILLGYGLPMHVERIVRGTEMAVVPLWSLFFEPEAIGALAFAMLFYQAVMSVIAAFNSILLPRFARMSKDRDRARESLRQAFLLYTPIAMLGAALAAWLGEPLVTRVDPAYLNALPIFRILTIYGLAGGYCFIASAYYGGLGRVRAAVSVTTVQQIGLLAASWAGLRMLG